MPRPVITQYLPHQPHPCHEECRSKRHISHQACLLPLGLEIPDVPPQIQDRRRGVHQQELHDDVDASLSAIVDVIVQNQQCRTNPDMMREQCFIQRSLRSSSCIQPVGENEREGVLNQVAAFDCCYGICEFRATHDGGVGAVVGVAVGERAWT